MADPASPKDHEAACRYLMAKGLCRDLAWEHATLDSRVHAWEIALALYCKRFGRTRVAWALARLLNAARSRRARHLREIALRLRAIPMQRRPPFKQVLAQKTEAKLRKNLKEAECWERDLLDIYRDRRNSPDRRRAARQELIESRARWEEQDQQLLAELVELSLSDRTDGPSISEEWMSRFEADGPEAFFDWLDGAIRDYVSCRLRGERENWQTTATQMPEVMSLDQLLALEWTHDKAALWRFIEASIERWEECDDLKGNHHLDLTLHNVYELCPKEKTIRVAAHFKEKGLIGGAKDGEELKTERVDARLRRRASRSILAAKAGGFHVTTRARL